MIGTGIGAVAFLFYALAHATEWEIAVGGALLGIGIGFSFAVDGEPRRGVRAAATRSAWPPASTRSCGRLGGALGAQLVASLLTGKTIAGTPIPAEAAYTDAFIVAAVAAVLAMICALVDPAEAPAAAAGVTAPAPA